MSGEEGRAIREGLARRREAALRLPPLDCGCHDPETLDHIEGRCKWRRRDPWPRVDGEEIAAHVRRIASMPNYEALERLRYDGPRRHFGRPRDDDFRGAA